VVIGLVDQDGHVLGQVLDDRLHFLLRHDQARRVVRVAQVVETDLAGALVGQFDHLAGVLRVIGPQRHLMAST
jgi:hypothetical protein